MLSGAGGVGPYLALVLRAPRWAGALTSLRTADRLRLPVTYWWGREQDGEWTTTDLIAHQALTILEESRCPCGCGGWTDECRNDDLQDVWEPRVGTHWRRAALDRGREDLKQELKEPGAYLYVHDQRTEN